MKINARIDRVISNGNVKAIASVSLDGKFVVKNLKVIDGRKGMFVSMPQESYPDKDGKTKYSNVFFALTNAAKMDLQDAVLQAYEQKMNLAPARERESNQRGEYPQRYPEPRYPEPQYPEPQYPDWVGDYDDILPMELG